MIPNEHHRAVFIPIHLGAVVVSGTVVFNTAWADAYAFVPLAVGLCPLMLAFDFWWKEPEPANARTLGTYFLSSLVGGILGFVMLAGHLVYTGFSALSGMG